VLRKPQPNLRSAAHLPGTKQMPIRLPLCNRSVNAPEDFLRMCSAKQYRAKADELSALRKRTPQWSKEKSNLRRLEQTYTTLAENEEWIELNTDKTIQRRNRV
jgi:hypothetical protein